MKYKNAKESFKQALDKQKTITIPKLKKLMNGMNIRLEPSDDVEIKYLKSEIKKLNRIIEKKDKKLDKVSRKLTKLQEKNIIHPPKEWLGEGE